MQNHQGTNDKATFILGKDGSFLNVAQEDQQATIQLTAANFPQNSVIITNVFPMTVSPASLPCVPFGAVAFQTIVNSSAENEDFSVCIDLTAPIAASSSSSSTCMVYILQTAKMNTLIEAKQQVASELLSNATIQMLEQSAELFSQNSTACLQNSIKPAFESCVYNKTAMQSSSNYLSCVKAYQYSSCLDFEQLFDKFRKDATGGFVPVDNQFNMTINGTTPSKVTIDPVAAAAVSNAVPAGAFAFIGGYSGYKVNSNAECGAGIAKAVAKCAGSAVANSLISFVGLNALTAGGEAFQNSVSYHKSEPPKAFSKSAVAATETGIGVQSAGLTAGNIAGCIIGTLKNLAVCARSQSTSDDSETSPNDGEPAIDNPTYDAPSQQPIYEEIDTEQIRGVEFDEPPTPPDIPEGGFAAYFRARTNAWTRDGNLDYPSGESEGLTETDWRDLGHYEFDTGSLQLSGAHGFEYTNAVDESLNNIEPLARGRLSTIQESYESELTANADELEADIDTNIIDNPDVNPELNPELPEDPSVDAPADLVDDIPDIVLRFAQLTAVTRNPSEALLY